MTNLEIQKYYQNKSKFKDVYSENNLPKTIENWVYIIDLDEYKQADNFVCQ